MLYVEIPDLRKLYFKQNTKNTLTSYAPYLISVTFNCIKFQLTSQQHLQRLTGEVLLEDFHEEIRPITNIKTLYLIFS
jgi:hypothetical protein